MADREAAFGHWLDHVLVRASGDDPSAVRARLIELDADGTTPRPAFLRAARDLLGDPTPVDRLLIEYRAITLAAFPRLAPSIARKLASLRQGGWKIAVVSNGDASVQEQTVQRIGLARHLDACVVSGSVGVRKPDPEIFRRAIVAAGDPAPPMWMVGDATVDVAGARAAGIPSIWISRGRPWGLPDLQPDAIASDLHEALWLVAR